VGDVTERQTFVSKLHAGGRTRTKTWIESPALDALSKMIKTADIKLITNTYVSCSLGKSYNLAGTIFMARNFQQNSLYFGENDKSIR